MHISDFDWFRYAVFITYYGRSHVCKMGRRCSQVSLNEISSRSHISLQSFGLRRTIWTEIHSLHATSSTLFHLLPENIRCHDSRSTLHQRKRRSEYCRPGINFFGKNFTTITSLLKVFEKIWKLEAMHFFCLLLTCI